MKTTVIIPNYNGIKYLKDCLDSLLACKNRDFAIIVVDNGSTDGSLQEFESNYKASDISMIALPENLGFAPAVNIGIEAAGTDYVLLLNNDVTVDADFVTKLEEAIERDDRYFSVSAKMLDMHNPDLLDGTGDYYCALGWAFACGKGKNHSEARTKACKVFSACAGAAIYRRELLLEVGGFDANHFAYLEDVDLGYRARINGYVNMYEPEAVCLHAGSASSGSRYNEFKVNLSSRNSIYLILKNMPLLQIVINLPFLIIGYAVKTLFFIRKGFGLTYIKGLGKGFALFFSKKGHVKKVHFKLKNLGNYCMIQLELWVNMIRRLCG